MSADSLDQGVLFDLGISPLVDGPTTRTAPGPAGEEPRTVPLTIQERFDAWSEANPWVLPALERLAGRWLDAGHDRLGMKQLWERLRWEYGATTGDTFKANNNYTSRAARALIERRPDLAPALRTRELRSA
ncbi:hypothetical protein [Nocardioides sp.]|uniref:hypothetical protein n=1 Tax=Nocardioides sp. TaxID=35761 RepID=UPI0035177BA9